MTTDSQTQFAILGLLHLRPMSGYDLKQLVDESIGHFWREGWGRIYPTLHSLERAGMVRKRSERKAGRRERNIYTLRPEGRKQFREWLSREWIPEVYRNELLLKVFFGRNASPEVTRKHVERFREQCATEIAAYETAARAIEGGHARDPDAPFWKMTARYGLHRSRALKSWAEETLEALKENQGNSG
jgi:DNA-binding PadR family transcriptional regulator